MESDTMGAAKDRMMEDDDARRVAEAIAVRVGLLKKCEDHHVLIDPLNNNFEEAYAYANSLITKKDPSVEMFDGDRRRLTDLLQHITDGIGTDCPGCEARNRD